VVTEEEAGRRGGDAQRRRGNCGSAETGGRKDERVTFRVSAEWGVGMSNCPYHPYCLEKHEVWQCVRLACMSAEHRTAIDIAKGVCLDCRAQEVRADGNCGRCGKSGTHAPEPVLPAVQKQRPAWTLVKQAREGPDFYECVALSGVARRNPGPKEARIKEIAILFDYKAEHTLVYNRWLADIDVEVLPTAPRIVTSSLGRPVETRQIAIIPLESEKNGGESVVIAAWVVEESAWSRESAPGIKGLIERFETRPLISMAHTYRKRAPMDLVVGRDNRKIFPEVVHEACLKGDDLFFFGLLFKPGQMICGAAQRSLKWTRRS
jgi:hypothetical protein